MRLHILRALLRKELDRHLMNRGGLALAGLLVVAALLLSVFDPTVGGVGAAGGGQGAAETGGLVGGVHHSYLFYYVRTPLVNYLHESLPPNLKDAILVKRVERSDIQGAVGSSPGVGAIVLKQEPTDDGQRIALKVEVWHPKDDPAAMAGFEQWFWRELRLGLHAEAVAKLKAADADASRLPEPKLSDDDLWAVRESYRTLRDEAERLRGPVGPGVPQLLPDVEIERKGLGGRPLDLRGAIATAMVVFALYFTCVYLLPVLTCEERERGVLLAQALSPASPAEILTAKFLFYPALGVGLAAILAGIYKPAVLSSLFFWLSVFSVAGGFLGIGMTVATLAKTQRGAFLGSMCYLLSVALILMICQQNGIPILPYLTLEFHGPRILHAAILGEYGYYWPNLLAAAGLAAAWVFAAGFLFRRRGWQ